VAETERWNWDSLTTNMADSIEGFDTDALLQLATIIFGGEWEYDPAAETFIWSKPENNG